MQNFCMVGSYTKDLTKLQNCQNLVGGTYTESGACLRQYNMLNRLRNHQKFKSGAPNCLMRLKFFHSVCHMAIYACYDKHIDSTFSINF